MELLNEAAGRGDLEISIRLMRCASPSGRAASVSNQFDKRVLWGVLPERVRDECRLHPQAVWEVIRGKQDVYVLSGLYTSPTFLMCALAAVVFGKKYVLWLERPHSLVSEKASWPRRLLQSIKRRYLRWLLCHATSVWCIGSQAKSDYQVLGAGERATRVLPYCCRIDRFQADQATRDSLRSQHGLDGRVVFLFSGQLVYRKGVDVLLSAFAKAVRRHTDTVLLVLGDGPLRDEHAKLAKDLGISSQVRFLGHRPQIELPDWFSVADAFVFPSRHDGWAVVVNEACAAGLPIIASRQTGAAHDLVVEGSNGFVLDCDEVDEWTERIEWCLDHRDELPAMGAASRQIVEPFSSEAGAARMAEFVHELATPASMGEREAKSA